MLLSLDSLPFAENPALFGFLREPGLVSVVHDWSRMKCYWRRAGQLELTDEKFEPFLWVTDRSLLEGLRGVRFKVEELQGDGAFRYLVTCWSSKALRTISQHIANQSGRSANHPESPQIYLSDPVHQHLLRTGRTMFNGMALRDLLRMQIVVYARCEPGFEYPNPQRDSLLAIALADNTGWEQLLTGPGEKEILERFCALVQERDPDVLEGHDLFKEGLNYLYERARVHRMELGIGRGGTPARRRKTRMFIAEKTIEYPRWYVDGRDVIDTWILVQLFDVSGRELVSYDLNEIAVHLKLASPREVLPPGADPERLLEQATVDVREIGQVAGTLSYSYFLQAQIFPYRYETVVLRGNATRINSLFLREYLRQGQALPARPSSRDFAGGLTAQEYAGIVRGVVHCDVQSLYPSIILAYAIEPAGDRLGIYRKMLSDLRDFRLEARRRQREAVELEERQFYGALQVTFKILINSFYGYLGFAQGNFADFEKAAEVTAHGRRILTRMMDWLREKGAAIVEVDTDGIYFVPPAGSGGERLVEELNATLPDGIQVELDGLYPAMYCHKMKNYALLEEDGTLVVRGSGLRSRSLEPFLRDFLEEIVRLGLQGQGNRIPELYEEVRARLARGEIPIYKLARRETLADSPCAYQKKIGAGSRNRAAVYEVALSSGRPYVAGDSLSYYVTGQKATVTAYNHARRVAEYNPDLPDFNVAYYQKKVREIYQRFAPLLGAPGAFSRKNVPRSIETAEES
ncbi:MAG: DNA polymerase II [Armatimonadetes bacterium]|nr:DNA polymerase II [Armatimonadota bacterium]